MTKSASELVCHFESLGTNCEFGFVQRLAGAEPMGLLRFAGIALDGLLQALRTRFDGIGEPDNLRFWIVSDEHRVTAQNFDLRYHTQLREDEITREELFRIECRKIRFLTTKLLEDLDHQRKIFVYLQLEPLLARDLIALLGALSAYGPVKLLWVVEADAQHAPGTVEPINDCLMLGYIRCFAPEGDVQRPHFASWIEMLHTAHRIWPIGRPMTRRVNARQADSDDEALDQDIEFGIDGNAASYQVSGWAEPEAGFTWAVGKESKLVLPRNSNADLLLALTCAPYVDPQLLPAQRISVTADGTEIASFILDGQAELSCPVPAARRSDKSHVSITFRSPDAMSPAALQPGNTDIRELACAFFRISVHRVWGKSAPRKPATGRRRRKD